jgi:AcrR family transcriptional regulator
MLDLPGNSPVALYNNRGVPHLASPQRQRSDAAHNREAILVAALDALSESGDASLNSIAKRAGVANATLYRHFPTRGHLVLEVYRQEVQQLVEEADELLERSAPVDALEQWVDRLAQYAMTKHGLADALGDATSSDAPLYAETYDLIVTALAKLLSACEEAGSIRPGLDADDVLLSLAGLWEIDPKSDWKSRTRRLYGIVFSGLRA